MDSINKEPNTSGTKGSIKYNLGILKKIKPLKTSFIGKGEVKGFLFIQVLKSKKAFLYEVNTGSSIFYEVFKYKVNKRNKCISYPTSRGHGIWSWTTNSYLKALKIYKDLNANAC